MTDGEPRRRRQGEIRIHTSSNHTLKIRPHCRMLASCAFVLELHGFGLCSVLLDWLRTEDMLHALQCCRTADAAKEAGTLVLADLEGYVCVRMGYNNLKI